MILELLIIKHPQITISVFMRHNCPPLSDVVIFGRVLPNITRSHHTNDIQNNCKPDHNCKQIQNIANEFGEFHFATVIKPIVGGALFKTCDSIITTAGCGRQVIRSKVILSTVPTALQIELYRIHRLLHVAIYPVLVVPCHVVPEPSPSCLHDLILTAQAPHQQRQLQDQDHHYQTSVHYHHAGGLGDGTEQSQESQSQHKDSNKQGEDYESNQTACLHVIERFCLGFGDAVNTDCGDSETKYYRESVNQEQKYSNTALQHHFDIANLKLFVI